MPFCLNVCISKWCWQPVIKNHCSVDKDSGIRSAINGWQSAMVHSINQMFPIDSTKALQHQTADSNAETGKKVLNEYIHVPITINFQMSNNC